MEPSTSEAPSSPRFSLLDSVGAVFGLNERERQRRLSVQRDKRESELVHCHYLKSVLPPSELAKAKCVVNQWAKKNDKVGNSNRRLMAANRSQTFSPTRSRAPLSDREPNTMPELIDLALSPEVNPSPLSSHRRRPRTQTIASRSTGVSSSRSRSNDANSLSSQSPDNSSRSSSLNSRRTNPSDSSGQDSSLIVLSDNESDEEVQFELAILRSLADTENGTNNIPDAVDNNSNSHIGTTSRPSRSTLPSSISPPLHICTVLNCEAKFLTETKLAEHRAGLKHSPCNPCRLITDSQLPADVLAYSCPECGECFQVELKCTEHMCDKGHRSFLPVVPISGYMCPQCMMLFGNEESCQTHLTEQRHTSCSFPFADDMTSSTPASPVPVSSGFAHDFFVECTSMDFTLFCIDCSRNVECNRVAKHRQNHPGHIISASSNSTPLDVFMKYLSSLQCNRCAVLIPTSETELDDMHDCIGEEWGVMEEIKVKSFREFIRLIGLKFILQFMSGFVTISSTLEASRSMVSMEDDTSTSENPDARLLVRRRSAIKRKLQAEKEISGEGPSFITSSKRLLSSAPATTESDNLGTVQKVSNSEASVSNTSPTSSQSLGKKRDNVCLENKETTSTTTPTRASKRTRVSRFTDATPPLARKIPFHHHYNQRLKPSSSFGFHSRARHNHFRQGMRWPYKHRPTEPRFHNSSVTRLTTSSMVPPQFGHYQIPPPRNGMNFQRPPVPGIYRFPPPFPKVSKVPPLMGPRSTCSFPTAPTFRPPQGVSRLPPSLGSESSSSTEPPSVETLSEMKLLIFLDLDNWPSFFKRLPRCLPDKTFVWGFWGGASQWKEPTGFYSFTEQKRKGLFHLNKKSGRTKDAADFSLVLQIGTMNALLPKTVPFTILSGDRGFCQVEKEICDSDRRLVVIDPHRASKESPEMFYTLIISVFQD